MTTSFSFLIASFMFFISGEIVYPQELVAPSIQRALDDVVYNSAENVKIYFQRHQSIFAKAILSATQQSLQQQLEAEQIQRIRSEIKKEILQEIKSILQTK